MVTAVVGVTILLLCLALVIAVVRDPGPGPAEVAVAYELAWDRLDFDALWTLSGSVLRDGLDHPEFVAAKETAYASRPELRRLARDVTLDDVATASDHALARTRVVLRDGEVVHNRVDLAKQQGRWFVVGYQIEADTLTPDA